MAPSDLAKSPPWLVDVFDRSFPLDARAQRRIMFGYPAGFVNGHMFAGLFQDRLYVRLPESQRNQLLSMEGAAPFEPTPGQPMKDYVVLPAEMLDDAEAVRTWVARALSAAGGIKKPPAKRKAPAKKKAPTAKAKKVPRGNTAAKRAPASKKKPAARR